LGKHASFTFCYGLNFGNGVCDFYRSGDRRVGTAFIEKKLNKKAVALTAFKHLNLSMILIYDI
jgi:hypothetical protein